MLDHFEIKALALGTSMNPVINEDRRKYVIFFLRTNEAPSPSAQTMIEKCEECGHEEFKHLYQTQICTEKGCTCNGWKESPYSDRALQSLAE